MLSIKNYKELNFAEALRKNKWIERKHDKEYEVTKR